MYPEILSLCINVYIIKTEFNTLQIEFTFEFNIHQYDFAVKENREILVCFSQYNFDRKLRDISKLNYNNLNHKFVFGNFSGSDM